jgi:hypothetical protein
MNGSIYHAAMFTGPITIIATAARAFMSLHFHPKIDGFLTPFLNFLELFINRIFVSCS